MEQDIYDSSFFSDSTSKKNKDHTPRIVNSPSQKLHSLSDLLKDGGGELPQNWVDMDMISVEEKEDKNRDSKYYVQDMVKPSSNRVEESKSIQFTQNQCSEEKEWEIVAEPKNI